MGAARPAGGRRAPKRRAAVRPTRQGSDRALARERCATGAAAARAGTSRARNVRGRPGAGAAHQRRIPFSSRALPPGKQRRDTAWGGGRGVAVGAGISAAVAVGAGKAVGVALP